MEENNLKRISRILVTSVALAILLSACGNGTGTGSASATPTQTKATSAATEIIYAFPIYGTVPADMQLIQDEVNKIALKEANVKAKFLPISNGSWTQQINMMIASGEKLDIMPAKSNSFSTMVAQKQLLDITDLMQKFGQKTKDAVGDNLLKGTTIEGKIYGITVGNGKASVPNILMRKDILDKYGLSIDSVKTMDDITKIYEVVSSKEPQMAMVVPQKTGDITLTPTSLMWQPLYDNLGDGLGVVIGNDNFKVVDLYESQQYASNLKVMRDWYKKGYILKDAATTTETAINLIKAGKGFSLFSSGEIGADTGMTRQTGFPIVAKKLQAPLITSSQIQNAVWVVPVTCKEPEAAMKFLNMTYSNSDVINLIDWGIENKHYVKNANGTIKYPDGIDSKNSTYALNQEWLMGNQLASYVWEGNDPKYYKILDENNKTSPVSNVLGFSYDSTKVKTEIANVNNVVNQYAPGLDTGSLDPEKYLPEFISKLKAAGIDKIIAEKQSQLDKWAAANKK